MQNDQIIDILFSVKRLCDVLLSVSNTTPETIPLIQRLERDVDTVLQSAMAELDG